MIVETTKLAADYTIPMIIHCPQCTERHIDEGLFADLPHHTHACQGCGFVWRPAKVNTHGVHFLPGYKNSHDEEVGAERGREQTAGDRSRADPKADSQTHHRGVWKP